MSLKPSEKLDLLIQESPDLPCAHPKKKEGHPHGFLSFATCALCFKMSISVPFPGPRSRSQAALAVDIWGRNLRHLQLDSTSNLGKQLDSHGLNYDQNHPLPASLHQKREKEAHMARNPGQYRSEAQSLPHAFLTAPEKHSSDSHLHKLP